MTLLPLPYARHALEPWLGRETVTLHYEKHHAGYLKKLLELTAGRPGRVTSLEWIIRSSEGAIFENAAQIWNHDFYWRSMQPDGGGAPVGAVHEAILDGFGSYERLRREFLDAGTGHFGAGWLWLVLHGDRLQITTTHDADLPLRTGDTPILCADLWEHAYYLDYRNERARYLEAFIDHLANWEFALANWSDAAARASTRTPITEGSAAPARPPLARSR